MIGVVFDDRYQVEEQLGEGGMGIVYRATQLSVGRPVALKVLRPEVAGGRARELVDRFHREARAVAKLVHPNTVRLYDFRETQDTVYIVTELLEGETLGDRLWDRGILHPAEAVQIACAVLAALEEAHGFGLVHRDLKPDNVFLVRGPPEAVKVLDFGLVKLIEEADGLGRLTQSGVIGGTPKYTSPENAEGRKLDGRSDIYSIGILLFEMITGKPPFYAEGAVDLLLEHIEKKPPPLEVPGFPLPEPLKDAVARCLEKKPRRRPASAGALRTELMALLPDLEGLPAPPLAPRGPQKERRSRPPLAERTEGISREAARSLPLSLAVAVGALVGLAIVLGLYLAMR